ncbi:MAG: DNA primase [Clostridia bacterium]|nr:DNA primase [Clostridia bacterium]
MPYYSDEIINEVFLENDIVDYVSQYVRLKKSGRDYSGLCPFHREKTPSFHVSQDKQLFHCFGCGASGNLVQFVMRIESLDFVEALKLLADRAGIFLPENESTYNNAEYEKKQLIYKMNADAARFFYHTLVDSPNSETARQYLRERKIAAKTITSYGLGYAPDSFNALFEHLLKSGYSQEDIIRADLAASKDGRIYDKFRNRIIFPIIDLRGNVIGFGGRIIQNEDDGYKAPKYLNSSDTPVFSKGRNLFSLNFAKREKTNEIILVEGYMDVISVYQAGVRNIAATLGTALTEQQAKLLLKYFGEILICYDSDEAGQAATLRAIDVINSVGGKSRVIKLGGAKDPDEYIKKNGIEMFRQLVRKAVPSTEFKLSLIKNRHDLSATDGKIKFINDAAEALVGIEDAVEVDAYIKKLSDETEIGKDAIYSAYKKKNAKKYRQKTPQRLKIEKRTDKNEQAYFDAGNLNKLAAAERRLLNLAAQHKKLSRLSEESLPFSEFSTDVHKQLAQMIYRAWDAGKEPEPAKMLLNFSGEDLKDASCVFYNMEVYDDDEQTVIDLINHIKREKLQMQINQEKDPSKLKELLQMLTKFGEE